ncbi:Envelopment polyprotein [Dissostichus eleginoides]|uniref:Envelopment polyprotein n=1 Tax=Dissostichus eleginoides TaxID=100907 RepID=A0AAD9C604_DISEL|nr:Envelopment polyprotein [Dissostichus eleginoides]
MPPLTSPSGLPPPEPKDLRALQLTNGYSILDEDDFPPLAGQLTSPRSGVPLPSPPPLCAAASSPSVHHADRSSRRHTPFSRPGSMQFTPRPAATDALVQTFEPVGARSNPHAPSPRPGCKPFSARPASPYSTQTPRPPPASLIIGDSIVRNIRSKTAATYCFGPG